MNLKDLQSLEEAVTARTQAIIVEGVLCLAIFAALIYSALQIWSVQ